MVLRRDLAIIAGAVPPGARVLDVGCGDGDLMRALVEQKEVDARGIELSRSGVAAAVSRGLSVVQGDADTDLSDYPDNAFDVAVLSQTLQATQRPADVLEHLLRISRRVIISFPNFGHWRARATLGFFGRMPVTRALPIEWYETPNIHLCTINDFEALCKRRNYHIERAIYLRNGRELGNTTMANLMAEQAIYILRRGWSSLDVPMPEGREQELRRPF